MLNIFFIFQDRPFMNTNNIILESYSLAFQRLFLWLPTLILRSKIDTEPFDFYIKVEGHKKMFSGKPIYDFLYVGNVYKRSILKDKKDIER